MKAGRSTLAIKLRPLGMLWGGLVGRVLARVEGLAGRRGSHVRKRMETSPICWLSSMSAAIRSFELSVSSPFTISMQSWSLLDWQSLKILMRSLSTRRNGSGSKAQRSLKAAMQSLASLTLGRAGTSPS